MHTWEHTSVKRVAVRSLNYGGEKVNPLSDKKAHDPQKKGPHMHRKLEYREEANHNAKPRHPENQT